ncbi:hypothetical protein [Nocardia lijiangensis]|uniref:hypothetical protein n=1 Tax=Nocardia lijiangensis TaxID=299618 RepID=UPI003D72E9FC
MTHGPNLTAAHLSPTRPISYLRRRRNYILPLVGLDRAIESATALCERAVAAVARIGLDGNSWRSAHPASTPPTCHGPA